MARFTQNITNIYSLVIFLLIVNKLILINGSISKCCPVDAVINVDSDSNGNCVKQENSSSWDSYNVNLSMNQTRFPVCNRDIKKIVQVSGDLIEVNGCLDNSADGSLYAIDCIDQPAVFVHKLNKCCAPNQSYDYNQQLCVPNLNSNLHFGDLFGDNVIIFKQNVPNCGNDEIFVEYHSTVHDIDFIDRQIKITTEHAPSGEMLQTNKYCIEGLVNTTTDKHKRHVIVRSCRPKTICDKIPCIRRCCKSDQMMEMNWENRTANCVNHPENMNFRPMFYDIQKPVESIQQQNNAPLKGLSEFCQHIFFSPQFLFVIFWKIRTMKCNRVGKNN